MIAPNGNLVSGSGGCVAAGVCREGRRRWRRLSRVLAALIPLALAACGEQPEEMLVGTWKEVGWSYEKVEDRTPAASKWIDGIVFNPFADRRIVRHEAESWEFRPDRTLVITTKDGGAVRARWRLKGRGHILTLRDGDSDAIEVYDVKRLSREELVLHYDLGMEVRGIARLDFTRTAAGSEGDERAVTARRGRTEEHEAR